MIKIYKNAMYLKPEIQQRSDVTTDSHISAVSEKGHRRLPVLHQETLQTRREKCGRVRMADEGQHRDS